ncbi:5-deoxy-glucuronate isomerase [Cohnella herbarum]|uniref:5-deoxy-glucuronate isomerase n=1 Tax=Cohnella herbarum TaxID=2728023 RepID=A0A7Z2VPU6_9BACL|nr:5-deoxy-glucuronate isomerase [Cohnella herbarum]QJD87266.1 5-deoxy-glucuronate isomerase [Cohnella herbarum]
MAELLVRSGIPDSEGKVLEITPQSAGWEYVGFEVFVLSKGDILRRSTDHREACLVLLTGKANVNTANAYFPDIGRRMNVFEGIPPYSVYVPAGDRFEAEALTDMELVCCWSPAEGTLEARLIPPEDVAVTKRGHGTMERTIRNILPEEGLAERLLVVEVATPAGHWSSYPPHKHDRLDLPNESYLEETYYHRINPGHGFAVQRVYTDDRSIDEALIVRDGDAVLVPKGYHPVSAPPGYEVYYLNVMAGPVRTWKFHNDPEHEWLFEQGGRT